MPRVAMNVCRRSFPSRVQADEWVGRQVVRHSRKIEYCTSVKNLDQTSIQVEILDRTSAGFAPETGDEPLRKLCHVWRQDGLYYVGIPAGSA